ARGELRVLEGLALHHVTPMTGAVSDRDEQRLVLATGAGERFLAPGMPVDGIPLVLAQVGARLARESVRAAAVGARRRGGGMGHGAGESSRPAQAWQARRPSASSPH